MKYNPFDPSVAGKGRSYLEPPTSETRYVGPSPFLTDEEEVIPPAMSVEFYPTSVIICDGDEEWILTPTEWDEQYSTFPRDQYVVVRDCR